MQTVVFFNHILGDGIGDLTHLIDILEALKYSPEISGEFKLVPVITYSATHKAETREIIKNKLDECLKKLGMMEDSKDYFHGIGHYDGNPLLSNKNLLKHLSNAAKVIQVSCLNFPAFDEFAKYFNKNTRLLFIGEHESFATKSAFPIEYRPQTEVCAMGLSNQARGIKLKSYPKITPQQAFDIVEYNDPDFMRQLFIKTKTYSGESFTSANILIPAYFNEMLAFERLLLLLAMNNKLPANKHICLQLSSSDKNPSFIRTMTNFHKTYAPLLQETTIKQITFVAKDGSSIIVPCNEKTGHKNLIVFYGHYLSAPSHDALYSIAYLAAVSGDTSFERAISNEILPCYISTNITDLKKFTLSGLKEIIENNALTLGIEKSAKNDLLNFFDFEFINGFFLNRNGISGDYLDMADSFDFVAMNREWPKIAIYLKQNNNFYTSLQKIFLEGLNLPPVKAENNVLTQCSSASFWSQFLEVGTKHSAEHQSLSQDVFDDEPIYHDTANIRVPGNTGG